MGGNLVAGNLVAGNLDNDIETHIRELTDRAAGQFDGLPNWNNTRDEGMNEIRGVWNGFQRGPYTMAELGDVDELQVLGLQEEAVQNMLGYHQQWRAQYERAKAYLDEQAADAAAQDGAAADAAAQDGGFRKGKSKKRTQ